MNPTTRSHRTDRAQAAVPRLARIAGGWTLVVTGVVMIPLPGPGLVVIFAGLAILGREQTWARATLLRLRRMRSRARARRAARRRATPGPAARSPRARSRRGPGTAGSASPSP